MPLQATSGAASYDAFGGGVAAVPNYIEDVFSTYLYTGNGSTQTITNGIDLAGEGGLVWIKDRSATTSHGLFDTARGVNNYLSSNSANEQNVFGVVTNALTAFNSNGFSVGTSLGWLNASGDNIASWTFRKQPKFFDVVTWTGDNTVGRQIPHNLGSVPGCIITKCLTAPENWNTYHRSLGNQTTVILNGTGAGTNFGSSLFNSTDPTSTYFTTGTSLAAINGAGRTYVAYLFAHNAGGFGLTGTDNVISCGSYSGTGATGNAITLGYEPQWVMVKRTDTTGDWEIMDAMRSGFLEANTSDAESGGSWFSLSGDNFFPTATGFQINTAGPAWNASGGSYIYIAIRRGPMKVPTSGTSVFSPVAYTGTGAAGQAITTGFVPDMVWWKKRSSATNWRDATLLAGVNRALSQNLTAAEESNAPYYIASYQNTGFTYGDSDASYNTSGQTYIADGFGRAPSFFDAVCYTGTGSSRAQAHNLGVAPELIIARSRDPGSNWQVFYSFGGSTFLRLILNTTAVASTESYGVQLSSAPTASNINLGASFPNSAEPVVQYLFASCPGVSKVGSYTGTGSTLQIDCGFTGGARFVLIKRTDSTGDWYVWDSARGIVAGNDPYLLLNSTAAEVTNTDYVDTYNAGFEISSTAPAAINANGGTFIFLAIA